MGGSKGRGWSLGLAGLLAPVTIWLGLFFLVPLLLILAYSFGTSGIYGGITLGFNPGNYLKVFDPLYLEIIGRTFFIAALNTLLCLALGYPLAYFIVFKGRRWRNALVLLVMVPFWTSLLIRAYAWVVILGGNGIANRTLQFLGITDEPLTLIFTPEAVLMGMVYSYLPFMILPLYAALEKFDTRLKEAAQDLGASRWHTFWRVTFPLSLALSRAASSFLSHRLVSS
jgi:spermidine/putrescine transport system permease protein